MQERCDQCRFFHPYPPASRPDVMVVSGEDVFGGGECRRQPPVWRGLKLAEFPLVMCSGWCGEFVRKNTEHANDVSEQVDMRGAR